jgi:hypothetical protein
MNVITPHEYLRELKELLEELGFKKQSNTTDYE